MSMLRAIVLGASIAGCSVSISSTSSAIPIDSAAPTLSNTPIDFEGLAEGTLIDTQFLGVTFGQDDGGRPQIDNSPFLFGYVASSGTAVLTGSTEGGATFPTVAGLEIRLDDLGSAVEFFLSDTAPLGDYTIQAFGDGGLLESFVPSGLNRFVGFSRASADIRFVTVDSSNDGDAFAIDDVRFTAVPVPEPAALGWLGLGFAGIGLAMRRRRTW